MLVIIIMLKKFSPATLFPLEATLTFFLFSKASKFNLSKYALASFLDNPSISIKAATYTSFFHQVVTFISELNAFITISTFLFVVKFSVNFFIELLRRNIS